MNLWCSSGAIHFCICYHWSTRPRTVYIIILRFSARPYLGLVGEADYLPINLHHPYAVVGIYPVDCFVLQDIPHLGYLLALDFQSCLIWTLSWGLLSVLEGTLVDQCIQHFRRGFQSFWWIFLAIPAQSGLFVRSDIFGGLQYCLQVFDHLTACTMALPRDIYCPSVPWDDRGSEIIG